MPPSWIVGYGSIHRRSLPVGAIAHQRRLAGPENEAGAVAYVSARIVECVFIAIGIVSILAIVTLRQDAPSGADTALGQWLEVVYEWSFRIGPGFFVGVGNGLILGWLMYKSGLVPRGMAMLGLRVHDRTTTPSTRRRQSGVLAREGRGNSRSAFLVQARQQAPARE